MTYENASFFYRDKFQSKVSKHEVKWEIACTTSMYKFHDTVVKNYG